MGVTKQVLPPWLNNSRNTGNSSRWSLRSMLRHSARPSRTSGSGLCSQCTALVTMAGCSRAPGRRGPPGRWAPRWPSRSLRLVRRVERVCKDPVGPQGLVGERGGAGPSAHLTPLDCKARKARQGTTVAGPSGNVLAPLASAATCRPEKRIKFAPIFRVVTGNGDVSCAWGELCRLCMRERRN